jgi:predicted deacylase
MEVRTSELNWTSVKVGAGLGSGPVELRVGQFGGGGPVGLLVVGVHGDEAPWALLALRGLLDSLSPDEVLGTLRIVPAANPLAVQAGQRANQLDGLDLNSTFPGDSAGTHTQRLAKALAETALEGADFVLDIHGGGSWNINCFAYQLRGSEDLAAWLGTRVVADAPERFSSLTGYAAAQGARAVWIEAGGRGEYEMSRAKDLSDGLRHALGRAGVLTPAGGRRPTPVRARQWDAVSASVGGIYVPALMETSLGSTVPKGTMIGHLLDPATGAMVEEYRAPFSRTTLALIRPTVAVIDSPGKVIAAVAGAA